jgi:hypothetical protein
MSSNKLDAVLESLDWAVQALCDAHPDAADYVHTQGVDAYVRAKREHDARVEKLLGVRAEINALANAAEKTATEAA